MGRIILLLFLLLVGVFIALHFFVSIDILSTLSDNFNKIAIGIAALVGVFVGKSFIDEEKERRGKVREYLKRFPHEEFSKSWDIIVNKDASHGVFYLFDIKKKVKHHILNMKTVYDMGWHIYLHTARKIPEKEFFSYVVKDVIKTRGEAGE